MGLDSAWVADHFVFPWDPTGPWLEAWSLLGGLAARTRRIQLGTMVSHVIYRNPAVLARTAMTVDRMSNGRLQFGLGTGASDYDWRLTGSGEPWPFAERVDRFVEAIEIVDGLLRGTMTTYQGRYYQVTGRCPGAWTGSTAAATITRRRRGTAHGQTCGALCRHVGHGVRLLPRDGGQATDCVRRHALDARAGPCAGRRSAPAGPRPRNDWPGSRGWLLGRHAFAVGICRCLERPRRPVPRARFR